MLDRTVDAAGEAPVVVDLAATASGVAEAIAAISGAGDAVEAVAVAAVADLPSREALVRPLLPPSNKREIASGRR